MLFKRGLLFFRIYDVRLAFTIASNLSIYKDISKVQKIMNIIKRLTIFDTILGDYDISFD